MQYSISWHMCMFSLLTLCGKRWEPICVSISSVSFFVRPVGRHIWLVLWNAGRQGFIQQWPIYIYLLIACITTFTLIKHTAHTSHNQTSLDIEGDAFDFELSDSFPPAGEPWSMPPEEEEANIHGSCQHNSIPNNIHTQFVPTNCDDKSNGATRVNYLQDSGGLTGKLDGTSFQRAQSKAKAKAYIYI